MMIDVDANNGGDSLYITTIEFGMALSNDVYLSIPELIGFCKLLKDFESSAMNRKASTD